MPSKDRSRDVADAWLATELDRLWLVAERALRAYQRAQIRPQPNHPSMVEVEAMLAARRALRRGSTSATADDDAALVSAIEAVEANLGAVRQQSAFGRLVEALELRPLEVETLMVTLAPHIDAALADVFAALRGQGHRRGVDLALVAQLFRLRRAERVALLDALDPERPLLRWRLLQVHSQDSLEAFTSSSYQLLRPSFDVVSTVCGRSELPSELSRFASLDREDASLADLRFEPSMRAEVESLCRAAETHRGGVFPWLVLWGKAGVGKRTIAARIAAYGGRPLLAFDPSGVEPYVLDDVFRRIQREALIRDAVLYVGPLSDVMRDHAGRELRRRLAGFRGIVAIGIDDDQPPRLLLDHPLWETHVRLPAESVRLQIWSDALPKAQRSPELHLDNLARAFNLTPGEIVRSTAEAMAISERDGSRKVTHHDLRGGVERRLRNDLGDLARRIEARGSWDDLVLPPQHMARVDEFISRKRFFHLVYDTWGYGERIGYGKGLIALLSGPPGTGKTMLASLIAQSLDLDLYQVDLSQVVSKWVGETEKQLGKVFDHAERAHAVLLFDEADSLFARRSEVKGANDRYGNMAVNYLLQRLEQYTGVAVLTTNKDTALDEALQRRLTLHLRLDIPEAPERQRLWKSFLPERAPLEADIDLNALALEFELTGGYIKNAAVRAAFLAASAGAPIDMEVLRLASALELEDMGRIVYHRKENAAEDQAAS